MSFCPRPVTLTATHVNSVDSWSNFTDQASLISGTVCPVKLHHALLVAPPIEPEKPEQFENLYRFKCMVFLFPHSCEQQARVARPQKHWPPQRNSPRAERETSPGAPTRVAKQTSSVGTLTVRDSKWSPLSFPCSLAQLLWEAEGALNFQGAD